MHASQSPFPSAPIAGTRAENPDMDMTIDLFIHQGAEVCVFHDKPFTKSLSWLEYDTKTNMIDFVMEDGDVRNFGIPVDASLKKYFHNAHLVSIVLWNAVTKKAESGVDLPLIIHAH